MSAGLDGSGGSNPSDANSGGSRYDALLTQVQQVQQELQLARVVIQQV